MFAPKLQKKPAQRVVRKLQQRALVGLLAMLPLASNGCAYLKFPKSAPVAPVPVDDADQPVADPIVAPPVAEPPAQASDSAGVARLVRVAALWDAVRLFHPNVATKGVEWDSALVRAIPSLRNARNADEYQSSLQSLLNALGDPITRATFTNSVTDSASNSSQGGEAAAPTIARTSDGTYIITVPDPNALVLPSMDSLLRSAITTARTTPPILSSVGALAIPRVVVDLRARGAAKQLGANLFDRARVAEQLALAAAVGPAIRRRVHEGWPSDETGAQPTPFSSRWTTSDGVRVTPEVPRNARSRTAQRVAIVVNRNTPLSARLLALVNSRQAALVVEESIDERTFVPTATIAMGTSVKVEVRVGELLNADGTTGITPDTVLTNASSDTPADTAPAIRAALSLVRGAAWPRQLRAPRVATTSSTPARAFDRAWYPTMGERLLGAYRIWATLRAFHAYRELSDEDLDVAFTRLIPRFESARDSLSYTLAVADLASSTDDSQTRTTGPIMTSITGVASAPFRVRFVDGRAIIAKFASDSVARAFNLNVGDEVTSADGYPMPAWITEHRRWIAASNDWSRMRTLSTILSRGSPGSADYRVRDANNKERLLTLPKRVEYQSMFERSNERDQAIWRELPNSVGYIDLDRVSAANLDSAMAAARGARSVILDMRGRLEITPTALWSRFATQPNFLALKTSTRVATAPCAPPAVAFTRENCESAQRSYDKVVNVDTSKTFHGRLVVLIDERTQGEAEIAALGLESGANATFIGNASAGASGDVTSIRVPGEMLVSFSGSEVRHADGRQLQRVGLNPQVEVRVTARGIRNGVDEVLERAQQFLAPPADSPARRRR